jgi:hypothetical protein
VRIKQTSGKINAKENESKTRFAQQAKIFRFRFIGATFRFRFRARFRFRFRFRFRVIGAAQ